MRLLYGHLLGIVLILIALSGCSTIDTSLLNFVDALNQRQIKGCYDTQVTFSGGMGAAGMVNFRGLTLTGGMTAEDCAALRMGQIL